MRGFAVGGEVGAWAGVAAGREEDAGAVLDEGDGEDKPGVLGDDVGDEEGDFGGLDSRRLNRVAEEVQSRTSGAEAPSSVRRPMQR